SLFSSLFLRCVYSFIFFFFFTDTPPTQIYTLSLHDALPISRRRRRNLVCAQLSIDRSAYGPFARHQSIRRRSAGWHRKYSWRRIDRKSTRLNSSHDQISYAVFCLKKKKKDQHLITEYTTLTI